MIVLFMYYFLRRNFARACRWNFVGHLLVGCAFILGLFPEVLCIFVWNMFYQGWAYDMSNKVRESALLKFAAAFLARC